MNLYQIANAMEQLAKDLRRAAAEHQDVRLSATVFISQLGSTGAMIPLVDAICAEAGVGPASTRRMNDGTCHYSPAPGLRDYRGVDLVPIAAVAIGDEGDAQ